MVFPAVLALLPPLADAASSAAGALPDPNSAAATGWLFVAAGGVAITVNQCLSALKNLRQLREPAKPDGEVDAKLTALRREIHDVELRMEKRMGENLGEIKTRLQTLESTLTHVVADINFALGKMAQASSNPNS
jgi:hypothetical protein